LALECDGYGLELDYPYLYVTSEWGHHFAIVDVSDPQNPFVTGICNLDNDAYPTYMCHKDTFAYVSSPIQGVAVINIGDVYNPTLETYCSLPGYSRGIAYRGNYLYVSNFDANIINIVDISDPTTPVFVNSFSTVRDYPFQLTIKDSFLYVALQIVGVEVFDISSPLTPNSIGYYCGPPLCTPLGIGISNDLVYLAASNGIFIFEYTGGSGKKEIQKPERRNNISLVCLPNPFTTVTRFEVLGTSKNRKSNLTIYDSAGRLVKSVKLETSTYQLGADLVPGIYFLKATIGDHTETHKLIKIR
jgi:hypothetical protein